MFVYQKPGITITISLPCFTIIFPRKLINLYLERYEVSDEWKDLCEQHKISKITYQEDDRHLFCHPPIGSLKATRLFGSIINEHYHCVVYGEKPFESVFAYLTKLAEETEQGTLFYFSSNDLADLKWRYYTYLQKYDFNRLSEDLTAALLKKGSNLSDEGERHDLILKPNAAQAYKRYCPLLQKVEAVSENPRIGFESIQNEIEALSMRNDMHFAEVIRKADLLFNGAKVESDVSYENLYPLFLAPPTPAHKCHIFSLTLNKLIPLVALCLTIEECRSGALGKDQLFTYLAHLLKLFLLSWRSRAKTFG